MGKKRIQKPVGVFLQAIYSAAFSTDINALKSALRDTLNESALNVRDLWTMFCLFFGTSSHAAFNNLLFALRLLEIPQSGVFQNTPENVNVLATMIAWSVEMQPISFDSFDRAIAVLKDNSSPQTENRNPILKALCEEYRIPSTQTTWVDDQLGEFRGEIPLFNGEVKRSKIIDSSKFSFEIFFSIYDDGTNDTPKTKRRRKKVAPTSTQEGIQVPVEEKTDGQECAKDATCD